MHVSGADMETTRTVSEGKAAAMSKDTLQMVLGEMYSGVRGRFATTEMRKHKISAMSEGTQLLVLSEPSLYSLRDDDKRGPVHDLAKFGTPSVQLKILRMRAQFDTPEFMAKYRNTPIDDLANFGCLDVQKVMIKLPKAELVRRRETGFNIVQTLASRVTNEDYLGILGLSVEILRTETKNGENVPRIMYNQGTDRMRSRLYSWHPMWNRIGEPGFLRSGAPSSQALNTLPP
jgi:hypothetical protein